MYHLGDYSKPFAAHNQCDTSSESESTELWRYMNWSIIIIINVYSKP